MPIREIARAKVNLTLSVLGRRSDGYHDIESLVTFADIGDLVTFHPGPDCRITTSGPFAPEIEGPNLLEKTLSLLRELDPGLVLGAVELEKNLPVAAGLGGGSADAAALLRAVRAANPERAGRIDWHRLAARLGADVPVCLAGVPALIRGIGDRIEPLAHKLPPLACVLVNPRVAACDRARLPSPRGVVPLSPHRPSRWARGEWRAPCLHACAGQRPGSPGNFAPARHRGRQGGAWRTPRMPARRHVGQRPDLLRHFRRRCVGGSRRCGAHTRASALVDRADPPRQPCTSGAQFARLTQKPMTSVRALALASAGKMASASRAMAP